MFCCCCFCVTVVQVNWFSRNERHFFLLLLWLCFGTLFSVLFHAKKDKRNIYAREVDWAGIHHIGQPAQKASAAAAHVLPINYEPSPTFQRRFFFSVGGRISLVGRFVPGATEKKHKMIIFPTVDSLLKRPPGHVQ